MGQETGYDVAICGTAVGELATPTEAIAQVLDARRITHLDLGVDWLVGVVTDGGSTTLVADLPRLLDTTLPPLSGADRAAYSEILLLASPGRLGLAVAGYRMARNCRVQRAGHSLRGLRHILGLVSPPGGPALPLLWIGGALGTGQRESLAMALTTFHQDPGHSSTVAGHSA